MSAFTEAGLARMHAVLQRRVAAGRMPGLVAAVSHRGATHVEALGALAQGGAPIGPGALFRISSMTKPLTAVAVLTLVEDCRIRLDDPIDGLIPELADRQVVTSLRAPIRDTVPANRSITVRDLLTFTCGYGQTFAEPGAHPVADKLADAIGAPGPPKPSAEPSMQEWIARLGEVPLFHQPGEQWMYNTSADIMGVLVERAADQPFETYLRARVLDPLGMHDTGFTVPAGSLDRLTTAYTATDDGPLTVFDDAAQSAWATPPGMPLGAAGLVSTASDLLAFGRMLLGEGPPVLSAAFRSLMATDQLTQAQKDASSWVPGFFDLNGWGLGLAVITARRSVLSVGAFGWDGGLGSSMYVDPVQDLIGVLLTGVAWTSPAGAAVREDFWTTAYASLS